MNHYFTDNDNLSSDEQVLMVKINEQEYKFLTDNGVFSKKGLDFGTRLLIESLPKDMKGKAIDLGCGYGPVGVYLASRLDVLMVDINGRALELSKKNLKLNGVDARVIKSDAFQNINEKFNYIITNPPIRAGKKKVYEFLFEAKKYLEKNGELWLVVRKNQGAKSLIRDLKEEYIVEIIKMCKGYCIIKAIPID